MQHTDLLIPGCYHVLCFSHEHMHAAVGIFSENITGHLHTFVQFKSIHVHKMKLSICQDLTLQISYMCKHARHTSYHYNTTRVSRLAHCR